MADITEADFLNAVASARSIRDQFAAPLMLLDDVLSSAAAAWRLSENLQAAIAAEQKKVTDLQGAAGVAVNALEAAKAGVGVARANAKEIIDAATAQASRLVTEAKRKVTDLQMEADALQGRLVAERETWLASRREEIAVMDREIAARKTALLAGVDAARATLLKQLGGT
jgi:hypothetical protein